MKVVKKGPNYTIFQKRSGRYGIMAADRSWIRGEDKVKLLVEEGLLKINLKKPTEKAEAPAESSTEVSQATSGTGTEQS